MLATLLRKLFSNNSGLNCLGEYYKTGILVERIKKKLKAIKKLRLKC